jgi:hypothetical protein
LVLISIDPIADEPLPTRTPFWVWVETPVPPYATPTSVPCQTPVAIVPTVVAEVVTTPDARDVPDNALAATVPPLFDAA